MTPRERSAAAALVLALLVLAAGGVWVVARSEREGQPATKPQASVLPAVAAEHGEEPAASAPAARRAAVLEAGEAFLDAGPFAPEPADGVALHIRTAQGGAPAERAVVRIARRAAPDGAGRARLREIAAEGERYLAGWDGALRVPRAERAVLLTAETSDGFAWAQLTPQMQELELELAPSPSLRVRVLEAEGRPAAGVPVALKRKPDVDSYAYARATTGRDGVATFRDALLTLAKAGESPLVVVELPLVHPPRATLAPAPLPVEPLELRLPACGSLEVRVLDMDGEPVRGERKTLTLGALPPEGAEPSGGTLTLGALPPEGAEPSGGTLTLGALPPEGAEPSGASDPKSRRRLTCVDLTGATVRFPRVELGRRFGLHFDAGNEESEELFEFDGPRASGELVTVDYAPYAAMHFVTGRALDTEGRPLRALRIEAAVLRERESRGVRRSARHVESDAEGRFRVQIGERGQRVGIARLELRTEGDPPLGIVCDVPRPLARGGRDLGDLALAPEQLIAAGTVRNERGMGVEEARVTVSVKADPSGREERWKELGHDSLRSDDEGRFVLRGFGVSAGAELRILAEKRGYMSLPVTARRGEERVVVYMALEGSLEGTILLEPELAEVTLVVVLRDSFGGVAQQECVRFGSKAEQMFGFQKVPAGAHALEVTLPGRSAPFATLHDVVVAPGAGAQDPRLAPLDLRGAIPRLVLSVRDPSGAPIAGAHASWRSPDGRRAEASTTPQGRVGLPFVGGALTVDVAAAGYRPKSLILAADGEVVLERGPLVRVVADGLAGLAPGRAVVVRVDQEGLFQLGGTPLDSRGEALLQLTPGERTLYLCVVEEDGSQRSPFGPLSAAKRDIKVEDQVDGEQVFHLELSTEELEGGLEPPDQGWMSEEEFRRQYGDGDVGRR